MASKWIVRLLALGGITVALGCRSTPGTPVITTPLYPEVVAGGPPPIPANSIPTTNPDSIASLPPAPMGAQLPKPGIISSATASIALPLRMEEFKSPIAPPLAPVLPPAEPAPLITSLPKPPELVAAPLIKPLLIDRPKPAAGPDGFAPAAIIPPPEVRQEYVKPVIVNNAPSLQPLPLPLGERFGHAPDYRWVAGVLDRHTKGGYWTLRYADSGTDDDWGGKVRLLDDEKLRDGKDGDVIYVEGELLAPRRANLAEGSYPPFRVTEVRVVEKAR